MQNALVVGALVSIVAGVIGFFVVLRGASFATHALAQVGFAGAAGAVLIGLDPIWGLLAFSLLGAGGMGVLSARGSARDAITALVMTAALGTGALFLVLNRTYATQAFSLLFGTIVDISRVQVLETAGLAALSLAAIAAMYRPLLFATVNAEAAHARGVPMSALHVLFLACIALTATTTIPTAADLCPCRRTAGGGGTAHRPAVESRRAGNWTESLLLLGRNCGRVRIGLAGRLLDCNACGIGLHCGASLYDSESTVIVAVVAVVVVEMSVH